jgi:hypothetical protein
MSEIRAEMYKAILSNPASKPRDLEYAMQGLETLTANRESEYDSGAEEELDTFFDTYMHDAVELILDDDPNTIARTPDTTSVVRGLISRIEVCEEELNLPESERWCSPAEKSRRDHAKMDTEAEAQKRAWRESRSRPPKD